MYNQKTRISKIFMFMLVGIMFVSTLLGFVFKANDSGLKVSADEAQVTADITKSSSTVYYRGQVITIDLGDGTTKESQTLPDLTSWSITLYYGKKHVKIDMQQALINEIKNDSSKDRIRVENFSTNLSRASSSAKSTKGTMKIICIPSSETLQYLGATDTSTAVSLEWSYSVYESASDLQGAENVTKILNGFNSVLQKILSPIIGIAVAVGMVFAIYLGLKLAKANNPEEREEAKKRVIYTIIGIAIGVALIIIFNLFAKYSVTWLGDGNFFSL